MPMVLPFPFGTRSRTRSTRVHRLDERDAGGLSPPQIGSEQPTRAGVVRGLDRGVQGADDLHGCWLRHVSPCARRQATVGHAPRVGRRGRAIGAEVGPLVSGSGRWYRATAWSAAGSPAPRRPAERLDSVTYPSGRGELISPPRWCHRPPATRHLVDVVRRVTQVAICVRFRKPSLARMCWTWLSAVR